MAKGYKVVRRINSKAFGPATRLALQRIRYRVGETTEQGSDHGPFAVFDELADAQDFWYQAGDTILEVDYTPSHDYVLWKKNTPSFSHGYNYSRGVAERSIEDCPPGTRLASAVTPRAVIERY